MIVTTDIGNILYLACKDFGIDEIYQRGDIPEGNVNTERIVILPKSQATGTFWKKGYVEVNLCVPDIDTDVANLIRLSQLERDSMKVLDDTVDQFDGTYYHYSIHSIRTEADTALKCHYVNVSILFEVLN